jgi:ATP-dependent DNA ligase
LWSRNGKDFTTKFPDVQAALAAQLDIDCVLDGELVVWTGERLDFDALQERMVNTAATVRRRLVPAKPASFVAFDVLAVDSVDIRMMRWSARRQRLEALARAWRPPLQLSPATADVDEAREWLEAFTPAGIERLVVKGAATRHVASRGWIKVNSVGVAVFDELTVGHATRSAMVRGELDCERHLSDTLRTTSCSHAAGVICGVVVMAASRSVGDRGTR